MATTDIHLEFPDDGARDDFEIAFRGWLKQYQQQAGLARAVAGGAKKKADSGSTGGLTGDSGGHSYGKKGGGSDAGLISLGSGSGYGVEVTDFYLNIIPGW